MFEPPFKATLIVYYKFKGSIYHDMKFINVLNLND